MKWFQTTGLFCSATDADNFDYDFALIKLEIDLTFSQEIQPICLPAPNMNFEDSHICFTTGWGKVTGRFI